MSASLGNVLDRRDRDLVEMYSFFLPTTNNIDPRNAVKNFTRVIAPFADTIGNLPYQRKVERRADINKYFGKQFNQATVTCSNVSRDLAQFVLNNKIEGMRLAIRVMSRAAASPTNSLVLFVGRCEKADDLDRESGVLRARQDMGSVEAEVPPRQYQTGCPLRFKGAECLGTQTLAQKSAAYQAAAACDKSDAQCISYANFKFFQGIRVYQIEGSFIHRPHETFLQKVIGVLTPGSGRRRTRVGSSLEDGTPYGKARPLVLGRWLMDGVPLQYKDLGTSINFLMAFCQGKIGGFLNVRCVTPNFNQPQALVLRLGEYGGEGSQTEVTAFPGGNYFSRLATIQGSVTGSNIAVEEPAPGITSIVLGQGVQTPAGVIALGGETVGTGFSAGPEWSDNPVSQVRWLMTDPAVLNLPLAFIDDVVSSQTAAYCSGAVIDESNAERLLLPNTETTRAGTAYKRYTSTGLITPATWNSKLVAADVPGIGNREIKYEFFDAGAPPPPAAIAVKTYLRKRYTGNLLLEERRKAVDVIWDTLLPAFRGYITVSGEGKLQIRTERAADSILLRGASIVGATQLQVDNVIPWHAASARSGKILIGVGLTTSEVRGVTDAVYSTAGNSITLAAAAASGPTATASGATLAGGSTTVRASATITIGGSTTEGATVTATIDGIAFTYTLYSGESTATVARSLAATINARLDLSGNRFVTASYTESDPNVLTIQSNLGALTLSSALNNAHAAGQETIRVMMSFAPRGLAQADTTRGNILDGSFKWPLGSRQTSFNQFKGTFRIPHRDWAEQPLVVNDYDHQDYINKTHPLEIDLSAVDNYHHASRILNAALGKYRDTDFFYQWASAGRAILLEEGDVVCVSDDSGSWVNVPVRIETLSINERYEVSITARLYSTSVYSDVVARTTVPLPSALNYLGAPPAISFDETRYPPFGLTQGNPGTGGVTTVRGGVVFGPYLYGQEARVSVLRPGQGSYAQVAVVTPDDALKAQFEFLASSEGTYTVKLEVCSRAGVCHPVQPTASIIVALGPDVMVNQVAVTVDGVAVTRTL